MAYIMVDIESDGPVPADYSMISFGAVLIDEQLDKTFYGKLKPVSDKFIPEALEKPYANFYSDRLNFDFRLTYNIGMFLNESP